MPKDIAKTEILNNDENKYYWIAVTCSNCYFKGSVAIYFGSRLDTVGCPFCGCITLSKSKSIMEL